MHSKAEQLKQAIVDRIRTGLYPTGTRLPGLRAAATEFGVHANTAAKVYSDLAERGIVRMVHGAGTFVLCVPEEDGADAVTELEAELRELAVSARRLGLSRDEWTRLVSEAESAAYEAGNRRLWFVECSLPDATELSGSLTAILAQPVKPLLVDDVPRLIGNAEEPGDLFVTTPFHVDEVGEYLGDRHPLVTVDVVPTSETLIRFARVAPTASVSVLASNEQTLERFVRMIRTYIRREPADAALASSPQAPEIARRAEVLIDSQSIHERVESWKPRGQVITVRYQIEPTSLAFLREVLSSTGRL